MNLEGNLLKMLSKYGPEIDYFLSLDSEDVHLNTLIDQSINLEFQGQINCIACGNRTKTSFFQGYCFPCFSTLPETDSCVMQPETCRAHEGISRDMQWSENHCLTDHYVYLALTSQVKVGVTRASQIPTRWIDQGAWRVIRLARTPNRYLAGLIEVALKAIYTDKTSWQKMLKDIRMEGVDLLAEKDRAWESLPADLQEYFVEEDEITELTYPVRQYPDKIKSLNFDKVREIGGILKGIRGQYLIFEDGHVFNVRRHNGYMVKLEC